jgi:hypothetical protein
MWDLCNQFVAVALTGGLLSLIFYIAIFSRGFGALGNARKRVNGDRHQEWLLWCLGSVLFANVVASFGINYMVQLLLLLFPVLSCISVATSEARQAAVEETEIPSRSQLPSISITVARERGWAFYKNTEVQKRNADLLIEGYRR